ncbi:MAG: PKD domain-containing protein [Nitrospirae bacterium]|nr:PKD domain-containing protein [Nitrospirota bacterium]
MKLIAEPCRYFRINFIGFLFIFLFNFINYAPSFAQQTVGMPLYDRLNPISVTVNAPTDVALDSDENVYIVESINHRLLVFSQSGQYKNTKIGLSKPLCVAVDNAGKIYIGNDNSNNVEVYDSGLNPFPMPGSVSGTNVLGAGNGEFSQPNSIDIDNNGNIYVVDYAENSVKVYSSDGSYDHCYGCPANGNGQFAYPSSIVIDKSTQEVIILDHPLTQMPSGLVKAGRIQTFQVNGSVWTFQRSFSNYGDVEGQMNKPQGVEVDDAGRVYVTDAQYHIIYVYDNNPGQYFGSYLGKITDTVNPMRTPLGIVRGNSNRLYTASLNTRKIEIYGLVPYTNMEIVPLSLSFQGLQYSNNPAAQSVEIRNNGTQVLNWTASTNDNWITLSETSGSIAISSTLTLSIGVDITGLTPGIHTGSISISSASGAAETVNVNLTLISNPPIAHTGGPYSGIEGQAILLDASNSRGGIVLYQWDINYDGVTDSYEYSSSSPTQSHTYNQSGTYVIKLKVTNQLDLTDESLTTAYIEAALPAANFSANTTSGAAPLTVTFTNSSTGYNQPLTYAWDFDNNGTVDSAGQNPSYSFTTPGIYTVKLTVTDSDGNQDTMLRMGYITVYADADGDGYPSNIDCNDNDPAVNPGAAEIHGNCIDDDCNAATADSSSNGDWAIECVDGSGDVGSYTSVAGVSAHSSYYDATNGFLKYSYKNGTSWNNETVDSSADAGMYSSMAVESNGNVNISYYDAANGDLKYAIGTSGAFSTETVDSSANVGMYSSIAVEADGTVHISYYDAVNGDLKYARGTTGAFSTETVDSSANVGMYSSIAVESNGTVHISYYDAANGDLKYARGTTGVFSTETIDSSANAGMYSSMAVESNGTVHISYYDAVNGDLKYAKGTSGAFSTLTVDSAGNVGEHSAIAMTTDGIVHITYYDAANSVLKYAVGTSSAFSKEIVDSSNNVGKYSSIEVTSGRLVHINYYDSSNSNLKHASMTYTDSDADRMPDRRDNCAQTFNPGQQDTDGDGYGNICDADLDNDGVVGFMDFNVFKAAWLSLPSSGNWNPDADLDSDNAVGFKDFNVFKGRWLTIAPWY